MHGRLVHRVTPADVGSRVTVRHRLGGDERHGTTDVVGELLSYDDGTLRVAGRDGEATVPETEVLASRVVPPAPEPRPRASG